MSNDADSAGPIDPDEQTVAAQRLEVRNQLQTGELTLSAVLVRGQTDDVVGKMRVKAVIESLPGIGTVRATRLMEQLRIAEDCRVRALGGTQRASLEREFGGSSNT